MNQLKKSKSPCKPQVSPYELQVGESTGVFVGRMLHELKFDDEDELDDLFFDPEQAINTGERFAAAEARCREYIKAWAAVEKVIKTRKAAWKEATAPVRPESEASLAEGSYKQISGALITNAANSQQSTSPNVPSIVVSPAFPNNPAASNSNVISLVSAITLANKALKKRNKRLDEVNKQATKRLVAFNNIVRRIVKNIRLQVTKINGDWTLYIYQLIDAASELEKYLRQEKAIVDEKRGYSLVLEKKKEDDKEEYKGEKGKYKNDDKKEDTNTRKECGKKQKESTPEAPARKRKRF